MKKIIIITILLALILSGCVKTKDFKKAYYQAKQCENVGLDFKLSEEKVTFISGVECIIK